MKGLSAAKIAKIMLLAGICGSLPVSLRAAPSPQQFVIETVGNSANTIPTTDNPYGGDPSCTESTPCANPLFTTFDTNGTQLAELGGSGSSNVLVATNSNWSLEGGASISLTNWCTSSPVVSVNDDVQNVVWTFIGTSNPCTAAPITGSYTVANGVPESDTFTISLFGDASGDWNGRFDNVSPPSAGHALGGSGNAPLVIQVHADFTVDETLTLPAGTLGVCQTQTSFSSTDPAAISEGVISGSVAGIATGDVLSVAVANSENTLWLNASDIDTNGTKSPTAASLSLDLWRAVRAAEYFFGTHHSYERGHLAVLRCGEGSGRYRPLSITPSAFGDRTVRTSRDGDARLSAARSDLFAVNECGLLIAPIVSSVERISKCATPFSASAHLHFFPDEFGLFGSVLGCADSDRCREILLPPTIST